MDWTPNHSLHIGDIIASENERLAIAGEYEVWQSGDAVEGTHGKFVKVAEASFKILGDVINTDFVDGHKGVLCIVPNEFKGYGIIAVKIISVGSKSVRAIPIDYIKADDPISVLFEGMSVMQILSDPECHGAKRIQPEQPYIAKGDTSINVNKNASVPEGATIKI